MQVVKFSKKDENDFFRTLRTRVNNYFTENNISKTGNAGLYFKTVLMFCMFYLPLILAAFGFISGWWLLLAYAIMGLGKAGIGLCVMHDANHGSFSKYKVVNKIMSYSMNLIGGSAFTWQVQHNLMHHSFTNIYHLDEDIDDKPFLRLSPYGKKRFYHRFQHIYALFIYCLATLSWVGVKDFKQLALYHKNGITSSQKKSTWKILSFLISTKALYFALFLILPMVFLAKWYIILLGFLLMHMVAGFIITVIFQLAHVVEGPEHHKMKEGENMENFWAVHQINTTANFSPGSKWLSWMIGGLNYQIEHHLFPHISHIHYSKISEIVKKTVKEFNLPYYEHKYMFNALVSHLKMLKSIGVA